LAALALCAVALEGLLRAAFGFAHPLLYARDAAAGYIPLPNQQLRRFGAIIHINAYGMRSGDVAASPPPGRLRILFIGDSVTFGTTYVDQTQIFTERLQADFRRWHGLALEVLNASAGGWAPANEYGYLRSRGCFGASLVLLVLNTNDLDQPFAQLEDSPLFPRTNPGSALGELWSRYLAPRLGLATTAADPGSVPEAAPDARAAAAVLASLEGTRQFVAGHGARLVLVYSPSVQPQLHNVAWQAQFASLRRWADAAQVPLIDLGDTYARHPSSAVFFDGIHLRPLGHQLAEQAIAERLAGGLLEH
jgi:uncharacterized protein YjeT (DUF2065 family)